jgi:hypothetical protein
MSKFAVTENMDRLGRQDPDVNISHPIIEFGHIVTVKPAFTPEEDLYMVNWYVVNWGKGHQNCKGLEVEAGIGQGERKYLSPSWPIFDSLTDALVYRTQMVEIATLNTKIRALKEDQQRLTVKRPAPTHTFRSNKPRTSNYRRMDVFKASGKEEVFTEIPVQVPDRSNGRLNWDVREEASPN